MMQPFTSIRGWRFEVPVCIEVHSDDTQQTKGSQRAYCMMAAISHGWKWKQPRRRHKATRFPSKCDEILMCRKFVLAEYAASPARCC